VGLSRLRTRAKTRNPRSFDRGFRCRRSNDNWVGAVCSPLQRCEPPGGGVRGLQAASQTSARLESCSEVSSDASNRAFLGPTAPRSTFAVSSRVLRVFLPHRPAGGFHATRDPLFRFSASSKPFHPSTAPECAYPGAPLLRSRPLQRSTETGARITRQVPIAGTVRPQGFSPSRRLASPVTMAGLFHPTCVLGVEPGPRLLAKTFRSRQGRCARVSSSRLSLFPRRARVGVLSSLALRQDPRRRGISVILIPVKEVKAARRVLQSLDRRKLGMSRGSEPRAPAFLRFVARPSHSRIHHVYSIPGLPLSSPERRRRHRSLFGIFRTATGNLRPRLREPASLPQTLTTNRVVE
jgi:hypothetical protein